MLANRLMLLRILVLAIVLIFAGRLAYLQVWHGAEFRRASENNYLRWVRSPAPRGRILDHHGAPLATSVPSLAVWLVSGEVPRERWDDLFQHLTTLGIYPNAKFAAKKLADYKKYPGFVPVRLVGRLNMKDPLVTRVEEELAFLPGVYIMVEPMRFYPENALASHTIGYLREVDAEELAQRREQGFRLGDLIGKKGLERAFEDTLRGEDGGEQMEVDALGRKIRTTAEVTPKPGTDLTLTLDLRIQRAAEIAMQGHRGAAVALDPASGDILALVSSPSFDINRLDPQRTEFNRALRGEYPFGSVFKIVTAAAALEAHTVTPNTYFYCEGAYEGIHCWKHTGHGALNLNSALMHSCNVYFMRSAEKLGVEKMAEMARRFGLGEAIAIDDVFTGRPGLVPDLRWAKKHHHRWMPGETLQMGMGQASLTVTPLQSARIAAAIANGGYLVHPRLIQRIGTKENPVQTPTSIGLQAETIRLIDRGLRAVVGEGTARQLDPSLHIAGKTGTAQNPGLDHAWFAGYAPAEKPVIAVAVLVENGGHGGTIAAPIAEAIVRTALEKDAE